MMNSLTIRIAHWDTTLHLAECDAATRAQIAEHYAAFLVPTSARAFTIHVRSEPGAPYISPEAFREWQIRSTLCAGRLEFLSFFEKGWVDWAKGEGALVLRAQGSPENFLRVV